MAVPADRGATALVMPCSRSSADMHERLLALGLSEPRDRVSLLHGLACVKEPPPGPAGVEVRRVETFDYYLVAMEVMWEAFQTPADRRETQRLHLRSEFEAAATQACP